MQNKVVGPSMPRVSLRSDQEGEGPSCSMDRGATVSWMDRTICTERAGDVEGYGMIGKKQ